MHFLRGVHGRYVGSVSKLRRRGGAASAEREKRSQRTVAAVYDRRYLLQTTRSAVIDRLYRRKFQSAPVLDPVGQETFFAHGSHFASCFKAAHACGSDWGDALRVVPSFHAKAYSMTKPSRMHSSKSASVATMDASRVASPRPPRVTRPRLHGPTTSPTCGLGNDRHGAYLSRLSWLFSGR